MFTLTASNIITEHRSGVPALSVLLAAFKEGRERKEWKAGFFFLKKRRKIENFASFVTSC